MKTNIIKQSSRLLCRVGLKIKKHSPEILMVAGVAGTIGSTILACKATLKVNEILEEKDKTIETIHTCLEDAECTYTEEDGQKDLTIVYTQTAVKLAKLYAPAVFLGALSITGIVSSHHILKKRNVALAAAYVAVDKGFKDYRKNVVDRFGKEMDRELRYNIKAKEIEEKVTDENGNETVEKSIVNSIENPLDNISEYARFFDECSTEYHKDAEYNLMFLRRQQDWANEVLKSRGHLFLNEVYDLLGIPRSKAGQIVGWLYNGNGDNYVDFGIYDGKSEMKRLFVNGKERSILLDFNVDGPIYDLI